MLSTDQVLREWGAHDRDDPLPLLAELRRQAAVHPVTLMDGHDAWLIVCYDSGARPPTGWAPLQGHARCAGQGERRRGRGAPRSSLRQPQAQCRPTRPHPASAAGVGGLLALTHRSPPPARPGHRRRSPRRRGGSGTRRPGRSRCGVLLPVAIHHHLRAARRPRSRPGGIGRQPDGHADPHHYH